MAEISADYLAHIRRQLTPTQLTAFVAACQRPLRRSIRVNTLRITVEAFRARVVPQGWQLTPIPWCGSGFWLQRPQDEQRRLPLGSTLEHLLGLFYIQEASSMLPAEALLAGCSKPRVLMLDLAAAPGSKTTQLAALTANRSTLVANELSSSRIKSLYANMIRTGSGTVCLSHRDGRDFGALLPNTFDMILLDAPCGGEGTVRKDQDALKHWNLSRVKALAELQKSLLESAFRALKPGGRLVYSTCTLSAEENEQVCEHLLGTRADQCQIRPLNGLFADAERAVTPQGFLRVWPQLYDSEGFFVACLEKKAAVEAAIPMVARRPVAVANLTRRWSAIGVSVRAELEAYLRARFAFELEHIAPAGGDGLVQRTLEKSTEIWLFPGAIMPLHETLRPDRCGIHVAELFGRGHRVQIRIHHEFARVYGDQFRQGLVEVSHEQARQFFLGKNLLRKAAANIEYALPQTGDCLVRFQGAPLGLARLVGQRLKNNLPRELICERLDWDAGVHTGR